jgi:hypothetical protein
VDVMRSSEFIDEQQPQSPKTPAQMLLAAMKAQKDRAVQALNAERQRQKINKARKTLAAAQNSSLPSVQ